MSNQLYSNLARDLHTAISAGVHRPGSMLPGEHELAATHGVSRQTVRAALNLLERDGLVERRRGAGTFVLAPRPPSGFGQSVLSTEELIHYASDTRRVVRSAETIVADKDLASGAGVQPGSRWLRLINTRIDPSNPEKPICVSYAYIDASLSAIGEHLGDEKTALCDLIAQFCGVQVDTIEQEMQGALISKDIEELVSAPLGSPALRILRRYRDVRGWAFMTSISIHPADRFAYRMKLERSRPAS
jgi:DNA-binding GntR family transcriptional regulator